MNLPSDVLSRQALWSVIQADVLEFLRSLPADCVSLCLFSPPYELARLYLEDGCDLGIARNTAEWVAWMLEVFTECRRICTGLVVCVCEGQTNDFSWSGAPILLGADLLRAGFVMRKWPIYRRFSVPGSGGKDWLRNDYEFCICTTRGDRLPWSDPKACGHPPKYGPGGEMSHRLADGTRVNQWGMRLRKDGQLSATVRGGDGGGPIDALKTRTIKPSHVFTEVGSSGESEPGLFGEQPVQGAKVNTVGAKRRPSGKRREEEPGYFRRTEPAIANPGNIVQKIYTAKEVAELFGEPGNIVDCKVGGGNMGNRLCHDNEAPFPEDLAAFFIRSFAAPGEIVWDGFCGSGTTGAMAVRWGRRFLGADLRRSQAELSCKRIAGETPDMFELQAAAEGE
jgi:DNA methylase